MQSITAPRVTWVIGFVVAFALVSTLVYRSSYAAFTATTDNGPNAWETGLLSLIDNDSGSAMFDYSGVNLVGPGDSGESCITVTNDGDLASDEVKLYADVTDGGLAHDVDLVIQRGTTSSGFGECGTFSDAGDVYTGTLADMPSGWDGGLQLDGDGDAPWAPPAGASRTFRFAWSIDSSIGSALQGTDAAATFTWESQAN